MLLMKKPKPRPKGQPTKSKPRRQQTFTSSQFSLLQDNKPQISMHQLFRNDVLKRKTQPKPVASKSQKQLNATKKRTTTKSKSKLRWDRCQTYEVIPYKNSLNSQIVFSNEDTKREGLLDDSVAENVPIRVNQKYLLDSNRQLKISIRKEYQRKVQAAVKIQKVFRGYLTRKILLKYVQQQQKLISQRLLNQPNSLQISQHSSYFAQKTNSSHNQSKRRAISQQQGVFQFQANQPNNVEEQEQYDPQGSSEELQDVVYRHHQPIYSHDQISGYLESSQEEDFDQDAFNNHIIFETNEEYIDSRKSSGQNQPPKNKLSRGGQPEPINEQPLDTPNMPSQVEDITETKTQKKVDRNRPDVVQREEVQEEIIKDNTLRIEQKQNPQEWQVECEATLNNKDRRASRKTQESGSWNKLKEVQMGRWDEIISLVKSQMGSLDSSQVGQCMKKIMEMSIKNRQALELEPQQLSQSISRKSSFSLEQARNDSKGKLRSIKATRQLCLGMQEEHTVEKQIEKKEEDRHFEGVQPERKKQAHQKSLLCLQQVQTKKSPQQKSDIPVTFHSPVSSFQTTGQLKKFLTSNIQDQSIQQMLRVRQDMIRRRQYDQLQKLNNDLDSKSISQEEFMSRIDKITGKYANQKRNVEKTKNDITRGYQAAMALTKEAVKDAKKLGYRLPISRSSDGLKCKSPLLFNDIVIDQLVTIKKQQIAQFQAACFAKSPSTLPHHPPHHSSDDQSSDLQFTQQQLKRFRRAQPYDIEIAEEIADLGRNVMITDEMFRRQQLEEGENENQLMKTQHVHRQIYQIQETSPYDKCSPNVQIITEHLLGWLYHEIAGQLLVKPLFSERLIDKNHFYKPKPVSDKERLRFIALLEKHFPPIKELNEKLNQKICPLPTQLLRCMRIDFSEEDDDDNSYEEIGKYEFIIGQEICNEAIKGFLKQIQAQSPSVQPSLTEINHLSKEYSLNQRVVKYVQQREKYIANRKNHTKQLRWQVLNIQIHCIFDAWNEQLIHLRSQKAGYSGIGLNELSLSIRDHNSLVPLQTTMSLIAEGKHKLIKNLSQSSPMIIFPQVVDQDEIQQLDVDSKWIFYADQALSYGLQLVYLIEEELFSEVAKQLRKKMLKL